MARLVLTWQTLFGADMVVSGGVDRVLMVETEFLLSGRGAEMRNREKVGG